MKEQDSAGEYDAVLDRAEETFALFLSEGRPVEEPPGSLLAELTPSSEGDRPHPGPARRSLAFLVKWLIARSHAVRADDPEKMLQWALMARLAADSCTTAEAGSTARLCDLRARAWTQLSVGLRVKGLLRASEEAITMAQKCSQAGTGDLSLRSWLLSRYASLCNDQKKFADAIAMSDQAARISRKIGEFDQEADDLVIKGIAWSRAGHSGKAVRLLEHAIARPEFRCNSEWLFMARHNLLGCYIIAGQTSKALDLASSPQQESRLLRSPLHFLRSLWYQGELLALLGHLEAAEAALRRTHRGFLAKALPIPVALLCQRLVTLNRELRRSDRAEQILAESEAILRRYAEPETLASVQGLTQLSIRTST